MRALTNITTDQNVDNRLVVWLSEQEIFYSNLRAHDKAAFHFLYKQYSPALYGMLLRTLKNDHQAKMVLEETFLEIWNSIASFDERKLKLFIWMNQIAHRLSKKKSEPAISI